MSVRLPVPSEYDEQVKLFQWLHAVARRQVDWEPLIFSTMNGMAFGGSQKARQYQYVKARAAGATKGTPDVICLIPAQGYHSLVIEMKKISEKPVRGGKGGVTPEQDIFLSCARNAGVLDRVCYGADEAIGVFTWYLGIKE